MISRSKILNKGQCSLEATLGLLAVFLLLLGSARFFVWINTTMVERQQKFEQTRDETFDWSRENYGKPAAFEEAGRAYTSFYTPKKVELINK